MRRSGWFGFANGIYWLLLGLWIGSLVLSAATAARVFPTMREADPVLPEFSAYAGSHGLLLAGQVMSQVFVVQDLIELVASVGIVVILVGHFLVFRLPLRAPANVIRILSMAILLIVVSYKAFVVSPRMYFNLRDYWATAKAGEMEKADAFKAAFDADHPTARRIMEVTLVGLIVVIFSSAAALSQPVAESRNTPVPVRGVKLEEPELLKRMKI